MVNVTRERRSHRPARAWWCGQLVLLGLACALTAPLAAQIEQSDSTPPLPFRMMPRPLVPLPGAQNALADSAVASLKPLQTEFTFCCQRKYFGVAAVEWLALEIIPNFFNHHVADDTTAVLSIDAFDHNVRTGFEWDNNNFTTNMFAHPFHGNVYFNSGRSNGYNFWESAAFAFAGSFVWEMFGENNRGAINDWVMTSLGGITIGEALHRTARMVRDNRARGPGRTGRELGAFFMDPVGGFSRAIRGEMSKVGPNPDDRFPTGGGVRLTAGLRAVGEGRLANSEKATGFLDLRVLYGDPFLVIDDPFDTFEFAVQWNREDKVPIGRLNIQGTLWNTELKRTEKVQHMFSVNQIFDYMENKTYEVGGQNFGFTMNSKFRMSDEVTITTRVQPTVAILTGINSEYEQFTGRSYDFGSGFGFRARGQLIRSGFNLFTAGYAGAYTHTLNGAAGNQIIHYIFLEGRYPLWRSLAVGVDYYLFSRNSFYRDFPNVNRTNPELRLSAAFAWQNQ